MNRKIALITLLAVSASIVQATVYSAECTNNLTIQPAGPRQGPNGLSGFNVEGVVNVSFASYGIAEWTASSFGISGPISDITSINLKLQKWHAAFSTVSGNLSVWMTNGYDLSMAQSPAASSPYKFSFDATDLPWGMDRTVVKMVGPFDPASVYTNDANVTVGKIGLFYFTVGAGAPEPDGTTYTVPLTLDPAVKAEFISRLNAGLPVRLIVACETVDVVGVFAGYTHTGANPLGGTRTGPTLDIDVTTSTTNTVTGIVDFGNVGPTYNTGPFPGTIPVSFRDAANAEIATGTASYDAITGAFSAVAPPAVNVPYRVSFKLGFWLQKTMPNPADPAAPVGNYNFGTVAPLVGDADDDNEITNGDYALWAASNGSSVAANTDCDFDGDGEITNSDYALWASTNGNSGDN